MPLKDLLIEEKDVPQALERAALAQVKANEEEMAKKLGVLTEEQRHNQVRRLHVRGGTMRGAAFVDVLGNGDHTRIWAGHDPDQLPFFVMDAKEMRKLIALFNEALCS